jgi:hypothetical protein
MRRVWETVLLRCDALRCAGKPAEALELLNRIDANEAGFLAARAACVRGLTLAALRRFADASAEIEAGLNVAREQKLRHDEALLLAARCELATGQSRAADPSDVVAYRALFEGLGVVAPSPAIVA